MGVQDALLMTKFMTDWSVIKIKHGPGRDASKKSALRRSGVGRRRNDGLAEAVGKRYTTPHHPLPLASPRGCASTLPLGVPALRHAVFS